MYKIFGSKESFSGDIEEVAPISLYKYNDYNFETSFGEGENTLKIACLSDTHSKQDRIQIPKCDLFIAAGDLITQKAKKKLNYLMNGLKK